MKGLLFLFKIRTIFFNINYFFTFKIKGLLKTNTLLKEIR